MSLNHSPSIVTDGLVLHLDAASPKSYPRTGAIWYDRSINKTNGTLMNGVGYNSNNYGSLSFNGSNQYIVGDCSNISNNFTISFYSYFNSTPTNYPMLLQARSSSGANSVNCISILFRPNGDTYGGSSGNRIMASVNGNVGNSVFPSIPFISNEWAFYCTTYNNSQILFYKNAKLISTATPGSITPVGINQLNIGINLGMPSDGYFNGNISQASIYSRVLSPEEILKNFNATRGRFVL